MAPIHQNVPSTCFSAAKYIAACIHLGTSTSRVKEAKAAGVKPVPPLGMNGAAFHMNFGAGIDALKQG
jgi:hypothetical protein